MCKVDKLSFFTAGIIVQPINNDEEFQFRNDDLSENGSCGTGSIGLLKSKRSSR